MRAVVCNQFGPPEDLSVVELADPEPEPGQKAVWIVLPQPPPNPQNPMAAVGAQQPDCRRVNTIDTSVIPGKMIFHPAAHDAKTLRQRLPSR